MMMLSAVVLLVGFLALAGMVSRVNQLGTQTGTESRQAVLDESGPLGRAIDASIARLANRTATACCTWPSGGPITASSAMFSAADIGLSVNGTGIPAGAKITSVTSSTKAVVTPVPTVARATATTLNIWRPGFALKTTTTPTVETAVVSALEQMQLMEAGRGLWMDWELTCVGGDASKGQVVASLSDATVWFQVKSLATFPRADCSSVKG